MVFLPVIVAAYGLAIGRWNWRVLLWRVAPLACLALATAVDRAVAAAPPPVRQMLQGRLKFYQEGRAHRE